MTIFVDILLECEKQARSYAQLNSVENIARKIERQQSIANLDKHLPSPIVKKVVGKTFRMYGIELVQERTGHRVIRFAEFFAKGQNEDYHRHLEDKTFRDKFIEKASLSEDALEILIQKRVDTGVKGLIPLDEQTKGYLEIASATLYQDEPSIYETLDWVELLKSSKMAEFRWLLASTLQNLVFDEKKDDRAKMTRYPVNRNERGVLYRQFQNGLLLVAPVGFPEGPQEDELRTRYADIFDADEMLAEEELRKFSLRTYPEFVVLDDIPWVNLQKAGKEANLSMSPEELALLHTLLTPGEARSPYPLFINGRPGSGKTTILHYLFAEHLHYHLTTPQPLDAPPLYLTYSSTLTERAKETVSTILACDYRRIENPPDMDSSSARKSIDGAFSSFQRILLSLLGEEARAQFNMAQYIDFSEFRKMWIKSVERGGMGPTDLRKSPELAWHAIRTFIKGRCPADVQDDDFGPDRYAELPKRQKSIDEDQYKQIYESFWLGWYKPRCQQDNLWDDQDLALEVLRQEDGLARYPAIICDEAQDFTSNELAVILRLSLFSAREVPGYLLGRIPFAFAGDPFQTLNPTGFDWNALSDSFRENLLRELDPAGRQQLQVNFQELEFNYRSAEPIVRLCNLVQLLRGILFEVIGLKPQQTWRNETALESVLFDIAEATTRDSLCKIDGVVFIVPSQEETELEYVQTDEQLSQIALADGKMSRDVFNPMRAKGMEFGRVVIYKFGDYCLKNLPGLPELLVKPKIQERRNRDRLTYEYFLNRLYVALSRARGRLLIVDSSEAIEKFWRFARHKEDYDDLIVQYNSSKGAWRLTDLGSVTDGVAGDWQEEALDDNAELGRQYLDKGCSDRDPYLLDRAANRFSHVKGEESNVLNAQAWACHFREDYLEAGRLFSRIPDVPRTLDNYWLAGKYGEFVNFARNKKGVARDLRFHAARYMESHCQEEDARALFTALYEIAGSEESVGMADERMREVLDSALEKLLVRLNSSPDDQRVQSVVRGNCQLASIPESLDWKPCPSVGYAVLMVLGGQEKAATDIWKTMRRPDTEAPEILVTALAKTSPFPENLPYLWRLGDLDGVLSEVRSGDGSKVPAKVAAGIASDIYKNSDKQFEEFALALDATKAFAVFEDIPVDELNANTYLQSVAAKLIIRLAKSGKMKEFFGCMVEHSVPDMAKNKRDWLETVINNTPSIHSAAIRALASTEIDRELLDIPLKDRIEQYFDSLIKTRNKELNSISPFEVGIVLELSGKYKLMRQYYELVFSARNQKTLREIVMFVQERLVFALAGLANVTKDQKSRRRIEEEYRKSARDWSVDLTRLPQSINLHRYREVIDRFYEDHTTAPIAGDAVKVPILPREDGTSRDVEALPFQTKPLAEMLKKPLATMGKSVPGSMADIEKSFDPLDNGKHRNPDKVTVRANEIMFDVDCNYEVRRIDIRNSETRDTVVVKIKNGVPSVGSTDFDVSRQQDETYRLGGWPVTVMISGERDGVVIVEIRILESGPVVQLKI
jgi:superfamily I DNA/RNA helicase